MAKMLRMRGGVTTEIDTREDSIDELIDATKKLNEVVGNLNELLAAQLPGFGLEEIVEVTRVRNELSILLLELLGVGG